MIPNHDHATLFMAPPTPATAETDRSGPVDSGAEALLRLRHPFAVQPAQESALARAPYVS